MNHKHFVPHVYQHFRSTFIIVIIFNNKFILTPQKTWEIEAMIVGTSVGQCDGFSTQLNTYKHEDKFIQRIENLLKFVYQQ